VKLNLLLAFVILIFNLQSVGSFPRPFDIEAFRVFGDDAFEAQGQRASERCQTLSFDVIDVPEGVVLPEEFLQETFSPVQWLGSEILVSES
jgi:hypothetical protein